MEIEEVTISAPLHKKLKNICNKCSKKVRVYFTCFKCRNIYHAKCVLKAPTVYVNENGHIFCCLNITSKCNRFESKLQTHENKKGKSIEEDACSSDNGWENSTLEQEEHENNEDVRDALLEKGEILEEVDRDKVNFVCSFCGVKFFEEESYRQHFKLWHLRLNKTQDTAIKVEKRYKCDKCSYASKWKHVLQRHLGVHLCGKLLKCMFKRCKCTPSLDTSQGKQCDCSMCEYITGSEVNLQQHILRKHSNKGTRYKCDSCMYSTRSKTYMAQHVQGHLNEKSFKCDTCEFKTTYKSSLVAHILNKHSSIEKRYKCNDCNFSAHAKTSLRSHIRTIHSDDKPFK